MPALAPGVRLVLLLPLWGDVEGSGSTDGCVFEADVEDVREVEVVVSEDVDADNDVEEADDDGRDVAAAMTEDGIEANACIACTEVGSGLPPTSPNSSRPHVLGSTLSLDVISKVGVLAHSSPEKLSTCIWQRPFCS